jgi:alpha-L-fucosidase
MRKPIVSLACGFSAALASIAFPSAVTAQEISEFARPAVVVDTSKEPVAPGRFEASWQSLRQYEIPQWFKDAKFGIWAHWGPQCQPEDGDWYARGMYQEDGAAYKFHADKYGHPSKFGFKDVIHEWKAENWNPDQLVALYKRVGAQYFMAMADHHDNFDMWDSAYQPWNSTAIGPKKNIIEGWARAAKAQGLPFGVSVHASHAWMWYEPAQGADKAGPLAGVPYDGKLTKADGAGQWWEGLDPQDLYAQNHAPSDGKVWNWNWEVKNDQPDQAYCDKFYNRVAELFRKYHPDLVYFDDSALPLWPASDAGLKLAADFYNTNEKLKGNPGVIFGKCLTAGERQAIVWDIERGVPATALPFHWQTDTCLGEWHYKRSIYNDNAYKSSATVIRMLCDIVSKNGNLLLNVPVRGDGSIDDKEVAILEGIAAWMDLNRECIFSTVPWKSFGEGPASAGAPIQAQGFNEGKGKPFTAKDLRFTASKDGRTLYVIALGATGEEVMVRSLGTKSMNERGIVSVEQLGVGPVRWSLGVNALYIHAVPVPANTSAVVFKVALTRERDDR